VANEELRTASAVDVVVVSYNSREHLRASVEPLVNVPDVRLVVVDNASPQESVSVLDGLPVDVVQLDTNGGFARGCNEGWRRGDAPLVLFLNPDARIDPESLRRLVSVLETDPATGIVGPRIRYPDGSPHHSLRRFPRLRSTYAQALFLHRLMPLADWTDEVVRDQRRYDEPSTVDWLSGACVLVRRNVLEQLDGLDEGFFLYCEDTDLCKRTHDAGFDVGGVSAPRPSLLPVLAMSKLRYARKHRSTPVVALERIGLLAGALIRALLLRRGAGAGHARALRLLALGSAASHSTRPS
jgi:N-acetylglucosaminyl-diphospho-decaprenol L-rhamnosyltransferase